MAAPVSAAYAADVDRRLHELYDKGIANFGAARVDELIAMQRASEQPEEAADTRSLAELIWIKDAMDIILEASPSVIDFSVRVNTAMEAAGLDDPELLPAEVRGPLEEENQNVTLIRNAASNFGFEL